MDLRDLFTKIFFDREYKEKITFFRTVSLFSGLSDRALGNVLGIVHSKIYPAGETVFKAGQEGKALYIVKTGEVKVSRDGKEVCRLGSGEFFGEMALLEEIPRTATVVTSKESQLLLIYKVRFDELAEDTPRTGVMLLRNLASILSARIRDLKDLDTKPLQTK
ncbi:MAG: cyclic nucleotide-binding domain-containing protein [Endomicrobiales bacterium]|nr:cyclic nucleotide-binding domain-containing protein [Endomicrobiales bacterium]